jgi:hypothetical protein
VEDHLSRELNPWTKLALSAPAFKILD